ncbi:complement factor H-like isoform X1 [Pteronotus mesoamericanus]|uniref:complement factor H-like isoform X1 n=1 Tax=Pteronotus mesoamericanus TaxID=1884717 RepID=UPI0023EC5129|nr:complement factor H-like isoform X1 [Pteronotus parnellii mesoamericanus]
MCPWKIPIMRFPAAVLCLVLCTVCVAQDCEGPPPKKEREILTGLWSEQSYPEGTKVVYKCRPGYRTYGVITVQCTAGQWTDLNPSKTCQKKPCGHPGDTPFGSFDLVEGNKFEYGAKVVYTCDEGYRMIGEVNFRECEADGWSNNVPLCEVIRCLPVADPENGRAITGAMELNQEHFFGQVVKFECNSGFMLAGPQEIHCSENGVWSGERPSCVEISCQRPDILHGVPLSLKNSYKENERLQYKCSEGYSYSDRAEAVCTQSGWTPPPSCKEVTCDPPRIANSHYIADRPKYRLGHVVTYQCKSGFYHSTRGSTSRCTVIGWEPPPRCSFKPCEFPEIKHGKLYREDQNRPYFPASVGQWYYYSCDDNYVTATRHFWDRITCTRDGWSPKVPCRRICVFNYLEHGYSPWSPQEYFQNDSVTVTCHPGYSLRNQQTSLTCRENGWSPPPKCVRVVTCLKSDIEIENGFISEPESAYPLYNEAKYKCKPGYVTEEGQTSGSVTCLQRGWSARPRCIKSCDMPVFENAEAKTNGTWFKVNDRLEYECQDGYKNRDGDITGSIICKDNGWSDTPTCHKKECIVPDIEQNIIAAPQKEQYIIGDVLKFSCRHRLKLVGPDSVQCYSFGWSPDPPTCKEEVSPCGPHPELPHGHAADTPREEYKHGEVVEYACGPRFLLKGSKKIQCVDGRWTPLPQCVEENSSCEDIPAVDHGSIDSHAPPYHHGESVDVSCRKGFTMTGHRTVTCIRGKWTQLPQCIATGHVKTCISPKSDDYEITQSDMGSSEDSMKVNYMCRRTSERKHSVCVNGKWDPPVNCTEIPRCPPPPQIPKSENMTTTVNYQEGETISILCQNNSLIQEAEDIVCQGGIWKSVPRCIEKTPCPQPPYIEHGTVNSSRSEEEGGERLEPKLYVHGTELGYVCKEGFKLTGRHTIMCHLGKWSRPPQCVGLPCDSPPSISNDANRNRKNSYKHGEEFTYRCAQGFTVHGPASVTCSGGKWGPPPECIKRTCSSPPSFDNAIPRGLSQNKRSYQSGEEVAYECQQYYQMHGSNVVRCINGRWIGNPTCRDTSCGSPPKVENANIRSTKPRYLSGDAVLYECIKPFDPFGEVEVMCLNGHWTDPPQCKESRGKCGPPPTIDNGDITTFSSAVYAPGASVQYQCHAYYELQGNREVTCRDGQWSEPPRCLEPCVISEEMMEKHNIQFRWRNERKLYSKTGDTIEFDCRSWRHRRKSPHSAFRVTCQEGKIAYPTCE